MWLKGDTEVICRPLSMDAVREVTSKNLLVISISSGYRSQLYTRSQKRKVLWPSHTSPSIQTAIAGQASARRSIVVAQPGSVDKYKRLPAFPRGVGHCIACVWVCRET